MSEENVTASPQSQAYRESAADVLRNKIERLERRAARLRMLLVAQQKLAESGDWTSEADEALWELTCYRDTW